MSNARIQELIEKALPERLSHMAKSCAHLLAMAAEEFQEAVNTDVGRSALVHIFNMALAEAETTYHITRDEIYNALGVIEDGNHQKLITPEKVTQLACEAA